MADGARIRISQESSPGAGDFDENVLGTIDSSDAGKMTVQGFYAYGEISDFSYNGKKPRLRPDTSHLFFVDSLEGLSLFIVHDATNDLDGGVAVMRFDVTGDRDGIRILVHDDPYSNFDYYEVSPDSRTFTSWHRWFSCCTDGLVLGTLEGDWKVFAQFIQQDGLLGEDTIRGLSSWIALSGIGSEIRLSLQKGRRVLLDPISFMVKNSITPRLDDLMYERLPTLPATDILYYDVHQTPLVQRGLSSGMRGDENIWHVPERTVRLERFADSDIEGSTGNLPSAQGGN